MTNQYTVSPAAPIQDLLDRLKAIDVRVWLDGAQLRCSAPAGVLTPELRDEIRERRDDIRVALGGASTPAMPEDTSVAPLTLAQERIWFFQQLEPESAAYNMSAVLKLTGPLDVPALERAIGAIATRHQILRTTFPATGGEPRQQVLPAPVVDLAVDDLSMRPAPARDAEALAIWKRYGEQPFDLATEVPLRTRLVRVSENEHHLLVTLHHIAADGGSLVIFMRELVALYGAHVSGTSVSLPNITLQYADVARQQRRWLSSPQSQQTLDFWTQQFAGDPAVLDLPTDYVRPAMQTFRGGSLQATVPAETAALVRALARKHGCTSFMVLLAMFKTLLYRASGTTDIVVGAPMAGRDRAETRDAIGLFINTLAFRTDLSGNPSFADLVGRVRATCMKAFAHQELPFGRLLEAVRPERDLSRTPLFQVMFNMFGLDIDEAGEAGGVRFQAPPTDRLLAAYDAQSKFDLTMYARDTGASIELVLVYNADLFSEERMQGFLTAFQEVVACCTGKPEQRLGDISLSAGAASVVRPAAAASRIDAPFVESSITARFAEVASRRPDALAIAVGDERMTYGELAANARRIAAGVDAVQPGRAMRVGLLCGHDAGMIAAILGVLEQGSAYVPLDPAFPEERLATMLDAAGVAALVAAPRYAELAARLAGPTRTVLRTDVEIAGRDFAGPTADSLAYILYTSGSTGQPKGVAQNHRNVLHYVRAYTNAMSLSASDRLTLVASYTFDASVVDIFSTLLNGATLYPVELRAAGLDGIARAIEREQITVYHSTPTLYRALVPHLPATATASVRAVVLGGEKVQPQDVALFRAHFPADSELVNLYGASEATIASMMFLDAAAAEGRLVPIGSPVDETDVLLIDESGAPDPVRGEIAVRTRFLALGYWQADALTSRAFVPVPGVEGMRLYRTGDLGRRGLDGGIEFLGRKDFQIKIRGIRIEPGEIEAALGAHPAVQRCVVVADTPAAGEVRLIAYVVLEAPGSVTVSDLKGYLKGVIPEYMVPAAVVVLDAFPLTRTGKIDRRALPPVPADFGTTAELVAPRDATEELVAEIWCGILKRGRIGVHENFFALGGHSLNATQVMSRLRAVLGIDIPLRALFNAPTIEGVAKAIRDAQSQGATPEPALVPMSEPSAPPLSYSQDRMWFLQQLIPDGTAYNMIAPVTLNGHLDHAVLAASLDAVAARHAILRTTFPTPAGEPIQLVGDSPACVHIEHDLRDLPIDVRLGEARRIATMHATRPFDLERGPVWWTLLLQVADDRHILVLGFHHIVGDLWSFGVFGSEVAREYNARLRGERAMLPPLDLQYGDFATWQRRWLEAGRMEEQFAFWKPRLSGLTPLELPTDRPRPPIQTANGDRRVLELPADLVERVRALSVREGVTPFMTFFAAFNVLLSRYSGQQDIAVGVPIANRTRVATESMIGTFVNTLVHRNDLSGNPTFRDVVGRVRGVALDAFAHQDVPFERLVREMSPDRDPSRSPLFQVLFNMATIPVVPPSMTGLTMDAFDLGRRAAQFDLSFIVHTADRSAAVASYNTDLFDAATIERMLRHYLVLLDAATREPDRAIGQLAVMDSRERQALLADVNQTVREFPHVPVTSLIAAQAARRPDAIALESGAASMTYSELDARANRLARTLARRGVAPGSLVGVCLDRSPNMLVALLGVMKAGCAYIPIDPGFPPQRVKFMLEDSRAGAVITETKAKKRLPQSEAVLIDLDAEAAKIAAESGDPLEHAPALDALAYVLYTSGSTGNPKGVQIPHRALTNFLTSMQQTPGLQAGEALLAVTTISFDIAGLELYLPLISGATILLAPREVAADGKRLYELLLRRQPTVMQATPATWRSLVDAGWKPGDTPELRVFCGGEAFPRDLADELLSRAKEVWNLYGPTETTIWSTVHRVTPGAAAVSIGRPIANTQVYVLDQLGEPTPPGVPGELYIGGTGLACGYLNRPELTAERFLADPFSRISGNRMYRTGDRARFRPDGTLEHLGRLDHQVKLRGYRIELGEIETALAALPEIGQGVVDVRGDRLVAYVVFAPDQELTASEIRAALRDTLPDYMIPSLVVPLESLPLTPNAKVDRRALPDPLRTAGRATTTYVPPSTEIELVMADVWKSVLGVERVSTTDNFFELGGHSLLSIRAVHEIQQRTGWRPDPRLLFFETLGRIASTRGKGAA